MSGGRVQEGVFSRLRAPRTIRLSPFTAVQVGQPYLQSNGLAADVRSFVWALTLEDTIEARFAFWDRSQEEAISPWLPIHEGEFFRFIPSFDLEMSAGHGLNSDPLAANFGWEVSAGGHVFSTEGVLGGATIRVHEQDPLYPGGFTPVEDRPIVDTFPLSDLVVVINGLPYRWIEGGTIGRIIAAGEEPDYIEDAELRIYGGTWQQTEWGDPPFYLEWLQEESNEETLHPNARDVLERGDWND